METISLTTPLSPETTRSLQAGTRVLLSGVIYAARDAAHKRMIETLDRGEELPFEVRGQVVYYVGPCPAKPGEVIGSAGPTTSHRMDAYTPRLLELGLAGMIGKGNRTPPVVTAMKETGSVYFAAVGGAGALLQNAIVASEVIAYDDLGAEAIRKLTVVDFPALVVIDHKGNNLYETENVKYRNLACPKENIK